MSVLITGGAGFLGLYLARRLLEKAHQVVLFDMELTDVPHDVTERAASFKGDVRDAALLADILRSHHVEQIVHLATALTAACEEDPVRAADVNCRGTATVFEAAALGCVRRVVYGSSVAVFNDDPALPVGDSRPHAPPSVYGATKVFSEVLAAAMRRSHPNLELVGLRFGWVYGPGRVRGWTEIQEVIEAFAFEQPVVPYPDFRQGNDWTYVDDAVEAIICCLEAQNCQRAVYNVSGDYRPITDAVQHLSRRFPDVVTEPYPAILPPVAWNFRSEHITSELGFSARVMLEEGLDRTVSAVRREHGLPT